MSTSRSTRSHRTWHFPALLLATLSTAAVLAGGATPAQAATAVTMTTAASPSTTVGGSVRATANIKGTVAAPTGTVTFRLYGNSDPTCSAAPVFTSVVAVAATSVVSSSYPTDAAGTYRWTSTYSGNAAYYGTGPTACSWDAADVLVTKARVTLKVTAQAPIAGTLFSTATVSGGYGPTGTVTFALSGPTDPYCSGTPVFTATVNVNSAGGYASPGFVALASGTYRWRVSYSGDSDNLAQWPTGCIMTGNSVVV